MAERIVVAFIFSLCPLLAMPQFVDSKEINLQSAKSDANPSIWISNDQAFTSVALALPPGIDLNATKIVNNKDSFNLYIDEHAGESQKGSIFTNLIVFGQKIDSFLLIPGKLSGSLTIYFLNAGKSPDKKPIASIKSTEACDSPPIIPQSVWRAGLPEPDYLRIQTDVQHMIIHHSATLNTDTNYTETVRNIYLFHTQVREWSDVGYNYLIAPDGTIFAGRDPFQYKQDEVKGAHFCGYNSFTMGICMLGNFMEELPTYQAIAAVDQLLTWKSAQDTLHPLGILPHALNPFLPVIAGHRDGCNTLCPGDNLYTLLDEVRQTTYIQTIACIILPSQTKDQNDGGFSIYPNPAKHVLNIKTKYPGNYQLKLFSIAGQLVHGNTLQIISEIAISLNHLNSGVYYLFLEDESGKLVLKEKLVLQGGDGF